MCLFQVVPSLSRAPLPKLRGALSNHWPATSFKITSIVKLVLNMRDHLNFNFGEIAVGVRPNVGIKANGPNPALRPYLDFYACRVASYDIKCLPLSRVISFIPVCLSLHSPELPDYTNEHSYWQPSLQNHSLGLRVRKHAYQPLSYASDSTSSKRRPRQAFRNLKPNEPWIDETSFLVQWR